MKNQSKIFPLVLILILTAGDARAGVITDAPGVGAFLLKILNFMLYASSGLAIMGLVASGAMYILSAGDEKMATKAKEWAKFCIFGIIVATGSLIIVKTVAWIMGT